MSMNLSRSDRRLLKALQRDVTRNQSDLAEEAGMSRTSCWRRMRDFEESGLIQSTVALLDPKLAGFNIQVLLLVAMTEHSDENRLDSCLRVRTSCVEIEHGLSLGSAQK